MFNINNKNLISSILGLSFIFIVGLFSVPNKVSAILYYDDWMNGTYSGYNSNNQNYSSYDNDYNNGNNNWNNDYYGYGNNNNINPVPVVFSTNPDSVKTLTNTTITVSGNNFVRGSTIRLNNSNIPTTFINSETLRGQINVNLKGDYLISVFNPAPGGGFSNAVSLKVINNTSTSNNTSGNTSTINKTKSSTKNITVNETENKIEGSENGEKVKELAAGAIFGYNGFLPSSIFQWIFFAILILLAIILWRKLYISDEEKHAPLKHA